MSVKPEIPYGWGPGLAYKRALEALGFFYCSLMLCEPYFLSILIQNGIKKHIVSQNGLGESLLHPPPLDSPL